MWNQDTVLPFAVFTLGAANREYARMEADQPDNHRGSRVSGLVAAAALLAVAVGGYLYYQNGRGPDPSSEVQQTPPSPTPSTQGTTASSPADGAAKPSSQQVTAAASAPTEPAPNQGSSQAPAASADNKPAVAPEQDQADGRAAQINSDTSTKPAASAPENAQSKPTSLPTNDIAYVQKSRANIRSEPSVRGKLVGQAAKGTKLNVVSRAGRWVQVESGETKGWINGNLLGSHSP
jgi:cytoskeletal protein RodZ